MFSFKHDNSVGALVVFSHFRFKFALANHEYRSKVFFIRLFKLLNIVFHVLLNDGLVVWFFIVTGESDLALQLDRFWKLETLTLVDKESIQSRLCVLQRNIQGNRIARSVEVRIELEGFPIIYRLKRHAVHRLIGVPLSGITALWISWVWKFMFFINGVLHGSKFRDWLCGCINDTYLFVLTFL